MARHVAALGNGLRAKYTLTGEEDLLDRAVRAYQRALRLTPPEATDWPSYRDDLGNALLDRYERTGSLGDLDDAVRAFRDAAPATPRGALAMAGRLNNLGDALRTRYAYSRSSPELDEAIRAFADAVAQTPLGSPDLPTYQDNLANGLTDRYGLGGDISDLDEAIADYETAVAALPEGAPAFRRCQTNLGTALWLRYHETGTARDLNRAAVIFANASTATPPDSPELPMRLNNLGVVLRDRYKLLGNPRDRDRAADAFRRACQAGRAVDAPWGLRASLSWGAWATGREEWAEAAEAYTFGMAAAHRLFQVQLVRAHTETMLRLTTTMHASAAYALGKSASWQEAAVAIERGRAVLLSLALERDRADLHRLRQLGHAELADHYRHVALQLSTLMPTAPAQALAFYRRYESAGALDDLDRAVNDLDQAMRTTEAGSVDTASWTVNLAAVLHERARRTNAHEDLNRAVDAYRRGCAEGVTGDPPSTLAAAQEWGAWATWTDRKESRTHRRRSAWRGRPTTGPSAPATPAISAPL